MQITRRMRLQSVIQDELSQLIPREVKDPRIPSITITAVEVTQDGSQATLFITILGGAQGGHNGVAPLTEPEAKLRMQNCISGLASASGFMRRHLARILKVRYIPTLIFREDKGFENAIRVQELLSQISTAQPS